MMVADLAARMYVTLVRKAVTALNDSAPYQWRRMGRRVS